MTDGPRLARRLGTTDAVVIGLGSMIGAGVFAAVAPTAAAVLALTSVNYRGVTRTARPTRVLVTVVLVVLAVMAAVSWAAGAPDLARLDLADAHGGVYGTLQAAGLLFFAFAGYARASRPWAKRSATPPAPSPARS